MTSNDMKVADIINYLKDKKSWGPGEWQDELDEFLFVYREIICAVHRNFVTSGSLNGYVYIPRENPWVESASHYDDVNDLEVHGGVTYGGWGKNCTIWNHLDNLKDHFTIGFDTAHYMDQTPRISAMGKILGWDVKFPDVVLTGEIDKPTYKNMNFVINELKKLVDQVLDTKPIKKD